MNEKSSNRYEIIVVGHAGWVLDAAAPGFEIAEGPAGHLSLTGSIVDQEAMIGLLSRLRDLRYEVLAVHRVM